jgi:signal peptide peptidase SppA
MMGVLGWAYDKVKWLLPKSWRRGDVVIPVVRLAGPIGSVMPFSGGMALSTVAEPLARAFDMEKAPEVAIIVNSPGGSPVQSRLIYERIRSLAEEKGKTVTVFVEDAAASGGYMIACAGDDIIADPASIVGSIGVVSSGFGFTELIARLGIDRRVHTAGDKKVTLDAFLPQNPEDVAHLELLLGDIHETFIDLVRERRGSRLKPGEDLFSGRFWTGRQGRDLGLVDAIGDIRSVMRARHGDDVRLKLIAPSRSLLPGREPPGGVSAFRSVFAGRETWGETLLGAVEARGLWARLGL